MSFAAANGRRSIARLVFALDKRLRARNGVFDYVDSNDCILRIKLVRAGRKIMLADGVRVDAADRVIELHFRNEHFPPMGPGGATIGWALRVAKRMDRSLLELCAFLRCRPDLDDVVAIRAVMPLRSMEQFPQIEQIASRFGFCLAPEPDRFGGSMQNLGQNAIGLLLVLASNPRAAHLDLLIRQGAPLFTSRRSLEDRYRQRVDQVSADGRL